MSRRSYGTRVFVGGLSQRIRERDVENFFEEVGPVTDIAMKHGFAFVEFEDYRDAEDAIYLLNGRELCGERISVQKARGTPKGTDVWRGSARPHDYRSRPYTQGRGLDTRVSPYRFSGAAARTDYRLIVQNLSSSVSWQDLKDFMRSVGEVTYTNAHSRVKNEGIVEFASRSGMKKALKQLNDTELSGRRIHLIRERYGRRSTSSSSSDTRSRSRSQSDSRDRVKSRR